MSAANRTPWKHDSGPALDGRYRVVIDADENMVCECYEGSDATRAARAALIVRAVNAVDQLDRLVVEFHPTMNIDAMRAWAEDVVRTIKGDE